MIIRGHVIHMAVQGALTVHAFVTLAAHSVSPELEAIAFCFGTVAAVWATDVERRVRHPHCKFKTREEKI